MMYLNELKQKEYSFGSLIPQSAKRSEEYLQGCFDIHNMFIGSFEKSDVDDFVKVKDVIHTIKQTDDYFNMTKAQKRDFKDDVVRDFFKRNPVYKACYKEDFQSKKHGHLTNVLLGWKRKLGEDEGDIADGLRKTVSL